MEFDQQSGNYRDSGYLVDTRFSGNLVHSRNTSRGGTKDKFKIDQNAQITIKDPLILQDNDQDLQHYLNTLQGNYKTTMIWFSVFNTLFGILAIGLIYYRYQGDKFYGPVTIFGYYLLIIASIKSYFWVTDEYKYKTLGVYQFLLIFSFVFLAVAHFLDQYLERNNFSQKIDLREFIIVAVIIIGLLFWSLYIDFKVKKFMELQKKLQPEQIDQHNDAERNQDLDLTLELRTAKDNYKLIMISFSLLNIIFLILIIAAVTWRYQSDKFYGPISIYGYFIWITASVNICFWVTTEWKYKTLAGYQSLLLISLLFLLGSYFLDKYVQTNDKNTQPLILWEIIYDSVVIIFLLSCSVSINNKVKKIIKIQERLSLL